MELREYTEYALQAAFSLLAISSVYMLDPADPRSILFLLSFPLLFAHTAYISSEGFNRASLASVFALAFLPLGDLFVPFAVVLFTTNILVSLLGGGRTGRRLYSSVPLPLLVSGIILGSVMFLSITSTPERMDEFRNSSAEAISEGVSGMIEETGIVSSTKESQLELISSVSSASVTSTEKIIINETGDKLEPDEIESLNRGFSRAESEVPESIVERMNDSSQDAPETGDIAKSALGNLINRKSALLVIPIVALTVYGIHPLIGLITAFFGIFIRGFDRRFGEQ